MISTFTNKCLSLLRLGSGWFSKLVQGIIEASRTISYVETVNPSQSDTLHKELKYSDEKTLKREYEKAVRTALKILRFGRVKLAIDTTEDPFWGKNGLQHTRVPVHDDSPASWQYINLSIVEPYFVPLMSLRYSQFDDLDKLAIDLLEYARTLPIKINLVLFDRGFYHAKLIDYLENKKGGRPLPYLILVPKNDAIKEYIGKCDKFMNVFKHIMNYSQKKSQWKPKTLIVIFKDVVKDKNGNPIDFVFATNQKPCLNLLLMYRKRWNIETGFRIHDEARIKSKSSIPIIRFFYHLIGMLFIIMWRVNNFKKKYFVFKRYLKHIENCVEIEYLDTSGGT
jgi:hypothetical protein